MRARRESEARPIFEEDEWGAKETEQREVVWGFPVQFELKVAIGLVDIWYTCARL